MEQFAAVALPLVGNVLGHNAFHDEPGLRRVAAGGEGFVAIAQKARLGKPSLRLGEHDVGRNQSLIAGVVALKQRNHRANAGIDLPVARHPPRLHHVGGRFVGVDAVGHAADDGILVGLLGQQGKQFADHDPVHIGGDGLVQRTAVVVAGLRFGIESIEVRRAAPHPDLDDRLGLGLDRLRVGRAGEAKTIGQQQAGRAGQAAAHGLAPEMETPTRCHLRDQLSVGPGEG